MTACVYAGATGELIAARAVLGIGAAAIFPLSLSVIPVLFTAEERQRAIALMAAATFVSFPIGPIVGGYLLDHFWWGSVFLINVPVVMLALAAVAVLLPESRSTRRPSVDVPGVLLSSAGLAGLTYGFIRAGQDGWTDAAALGTIAAGAAGLAALVAWERWLTGRAVRVRPLIELGLFRSSGFTWGTALSTLVSFAMFGIFFAMPQYFQEVRGADAMGSGLRLLPMIGGLVIGMIGSTRLASPRTTADGQTGAPQASAKALVTAGFAVMAAALGLGATTAVSSGTGFTAGWFAAFGLGLGLAMPQAMNAALSALSAERSGSGSALISALRQVGATVGVAVLGTVLGSVYRGHLAAASLDRLPARPARRPCSARSGRRSCRAWTPCSGSAAASRWPAPSSRSFSCRGGRTGPPPRRSPGTRPPPPAAKPAPNGQNWKREPHARHEPGPAAGPARAQEGPDACFPQGARAPAVPRERLPGHHRGEDRRGRRGIGQHVLPLLPDQGRPRPAGRHGHPADRGARAAARRARRDRGGPRRHPAGDRLLQRGRPGRDPPGHRPHHDRARGAGPGHGRVRPHDHGGRRGPGQARRTPGGRPCRPHRGRRHHVDHAALGRLDGRQRTLEGTFERIEQALALLEDGLPL